MMARRRPGQRSFGAGLLEEETAALWEPWMRPADRVREEAKLVHAVYEALLKRRPQSRTRRRRGVAAAIVLRRMRRKHSRNWSFAELERELRPHLLYREFSRVGSGKGPDAKTLGRQAQAGGPAGIEPMHQRRVALAVEHKGVQGRKRRVDTTVVETQIPYPSDSRLRGDGARVLTRLMKKLTAIAGAAGTKLRHRMRSVQRRLAEMARPSRANSDKVQEKVPPPLPQAAGNHGPGHGTGQALFFRDRQRRPARF